MVGMFARILMPEMPDPEMATPMMIMSLLPIGLAGLVIASYIAIVMSTADSCLIGPVAIFTKDIYKKYLRPEASESDMLRMARIMTIVLGLGTIASAFLVLLGFFEINLLRALNADLYGLATGFPANI